MSPRNKNGSGKYEALEKSEGSRTCSVDESSLYECKEHPQPRPDKYKWLRTNFLKIAQLVVLIDIAVLLTIDVTATIAARVRRSKSCGHHIQEVEKLPDFLDYTMKYEEREEWGMGEYTAPFNLPPSDELDAVWDELLEAKNIRVAPHEVHQLNANRSHKVRVNDGDYVGVLGPYHQLHCLNIIRRIIHWDYYGPRMSKAERESYLWTHHHSDHCLELFRQNTMCHAYPTFYMGEWVADSQEFPNIELRPQGVARCANWKSLDEWARKRALIPNHFKMRPGPFEKKHEDNRKTSEI